MCVFFSGEEPESLRGPQAEMVIVDEIARMRYQQSVFDTMMLGLRLGDRPRVLIATTPRTTPFMKRLVAMDDVRITSVDRTGTQTTAAPARPTPRVSGEVVCSQPGRNFFTARQNKPPVDQIRPMGPGDHRRCSRSSSLPAVPAASARCLNLPPRQLIGNLLDGHVAKLDQNRPQRFRITVGHTSKAGVRRT